MKSVITAICLLIPLVILFVIIDRKDFYSGDDVTIQQETMSGRTPTAVITLKPVAQPTETKPVAETKPAEVNEAQPAEAKPVETKTVSETKPAERKPVAVTKPATTSPVETKPMPENKPVSETKPVEMKSTETKPVAEKPVTETKSAEGELVPAAIPVVTAEESVKLNEFAIFLSNVKTTVVEGEIVERSGLPDPQKSDYPNCRFTVHFNGNSVKSGEPCPKELSLIVEGFEDYRVLSNNDIKIGDKVKCTIIPFDKLPEEFQSTQQSDDLELFLLESYYVVDIRPIKSYSDDPFMPKSGLFFSAGNKDYVSIYERHINPPISQDIIDAQNRSIAEDLKQMNALLEEYDDDRYKELNDSFNKAWMAEKLKDPEGYNRVKGIVWRQIDNSFWCLPNNYSFLSKPDMLTQNSLDCFAALKKACEVNGVQLIVSLVPQLYVISSRVINNSFRGVADIQTATFVKQLSEIGVETIYPSEAIVRNYNRYPFAFFYPDNGHPSDTTQDVITDILVERLTRYGFKSELAPDLFSVRQSPHVYGTNEKYLFPENCDIGDNKAGKPYTNREILYADKQIPLSKDAQFITIGNSYQQTPMNSPDSVPTLLSYKLKTTVDWYRIGGYGPFSDIIIQLLTRADFFLKNKKALILYVGTDHLRYTNNTGTILNLANLDKARVLLNKKKLITHFIPVSNTNEDFNDSESWGTLSSAEKSCFSIKDNDESIFSIRIDQGNDAVIDNSKPLVCIIPSACFPQTSCSLCVNGQTHLIPSFYSRYESKFFNLSFELPAGTSEIMINAEGKIGTKFVIKDIQLWQ